MDCMLQGARPARKPANASVGALVAGVMASLDTQAAQLVVQSLYRLAQDDARSGHAKGAVTAGMREALAAAFERGPKRASYVGALQRLALEGGSGGGVDAQRAAEAARASGSLQAGALQVGGILCAKNHHTPLAAQDASTVSPFSGQESAEPLALS